MIDDRISGAPQVAVPAHEMTQGSGGKQNGRREEKHGRQDSSDEVMKHYDELAALVDQANLRLDEEKSPLRFVLTRETGSIVIDIIRPSDSGGPVSVLRKNITHEKFREAVMHILEGEGLIIDTMG